MKEKTISIYAYKFNGLLYRRWEFPGVIEQNKNYICVNLTNSRVIMFKKEKNKHVFSKILNKTFWYFFTNKWYNTIVSIRNNKYYVYINVASPFIYEDECIKYIDLDIDYKTNNIIFNRWVELDRDEFEENSVTYMYPEELKQKISNVITEIKSLIEQHFFNKYTEILKT
jgi:protein associated with RNAse G/E